MSQMSSLYDLAITSYALAKSGSSLGAVAFNKLEKFAVLKGTYTASETYITIGLMMTL